MNPKRPAAFLRLCALLAVLLSAVPALPPAAARAESVSARRREILAGVRRVLVIAPFYGTGALRKPEGEDKSEGKDAKPARPADAKAREALAAYTEQLRKLEAHAAARLAARAALRLPYEIVGPEKIAPTLTSLSLTAPKLFQNDGRMRGSKFPAPDPALVRKLAEAADTQAVLLTILDEPRRNNQRTFFTEFGIAFESGHVRSKAAYFLMARDGTEILRETIEVLRPLTRHASRDYVFVDWREALDQTVENLMDEITRYTPPSMSDYAVKEPAPPR